MQYQTFKLFGESQLTEIKHQLNDLIKKLFNGWFGKDHAFEVSKITSNQAIAIQVDDCDLYASTLNTWLAFKMQESMKVNILNEMIGLSSKPLTRITKFNAEIFQHFLNSIIDEIYSVSSLAFIQDQHVASINTKKGSGALKCLVSNGHLKFEILIGGGLTSALCKSIKNSVINNPNLQQREDLISKPAVKLNLHAGSARMQLKELTKLELGDIVVLDKTLGSNFIVKTDSARYLAQAKLGKTDSQKVIQFINR